ncbi:hypothetical protein [Cellulomonas soli]
MRIARALPVPVLLVALTLGGCTSGSDATDATSVAPTDAAVVADPGITVDQVDPDAVLAEATFDVVDQPGDKVTIGVESLVVEGKTMELRLIVTPLFTSVDADETVSIYDTASGTNWSPTLTDRENLKQYFILSETGLRWQTDVVYSAAVSGASVRYQAWFAAPQDDVDTLDVMITDAWPQFEDVPVTYSDED